MRVSSYDPDEALAGRDAPNIGGFGSHGYISAPQGPPRASAVISAPPHNYNEKTMLLSSDDEYQ